MRKDVVIAGMNHASGGRALLRGSVLIVPLIATSYLAINVTAWWAWGLHLVLATFLFCTLPAVYHEAAHNNLSRSPTVNDIAGTLAAALHAVPFATWRYFHLAHHANTGTAKDSEVYGTRWSRARLILFPFTQWAFLVILWRWTFSTVAGRGPRWIRSDRQRRAVTVNVIATTVVWSGMILGCVWQPQLIILLIAPCALSIVVAALTLVPEHFPAYDTEPGDADQLDRTATFRSNRILRLILWNSNFHAAHHFAPKVPAHRLPELDKMISSIQDPRWRWLGYYHWYCHHLARLSWATVDLATGSNRIAETVEEK
ncbi:fatty acid desaturase family protein [Nocardia nepalensis]|uniref:fatty acid desaturase family protein n=1 Tax=Nocardia nepalensis TaxID=3375448 RepID=UPI003B67F403